MHLKTKLLLILLLIFSIFATINYGIHHYIILPGFKTLEISEATKNMERCIRAINEEILHVDIICHDWAAWDSLHDFMPSPDPAFVKSNLNPDTMVNNQLNLACITDLSGKALFCEAWDFSQTEKRVLTGLPEQLLTAANSLALSPPDGRQLSGMKVSGIYNSDRGPMMVSSRPIITSDNRGPVRGTLTLGRLLDATLIEHLAKQVEVDFKILAMEGKGLTREEREISRDLNAEEFRIIEKSDNDSLMVYAHLPEIGGGQGFLICAELPRQIMAKGRTTLTYSLTLISVLGLFMVFLVLFLLRKIVVSPIITLTDHVLKVAKTGDLSARISLPRNDEIGTLGREVNRMVWQIENQTDELAGLNATLKSDIEKRKRVEQELRESEERFRILHEASFGGMVIHDKGRIIDVNQTLSTITGYEPGELTGMDGFKLIAPSWHETVRANIEADLEHAYDVEGIRKDGSVYPLEIQGKSIPFRGRMVRVTEFRDITSRKEMEQQLKHAMEELKTIVNNSQVGIMFLRGGRILYQGNQRLADILGYDSPEAMVGLNMKALHLSEDRYVEFGEKYFSRLVHGEQIQVEYELRRRDGFSVWCTLSGKAIDPSIPPDLSKGVVWMLDDITEKRQYQQKLEEIATTDYLTGLYNRRHFTKLAAVELERQKRYSHRCLSLIMLDIDHFKAINDTHGHDAGDLVLKSFTEIGGKTLRNMDVFARVGGEEFVILLPDTDLTGASAIAERFRQTIEKSSVISDKDKINVTVSLGVTTWNSRIEDIGTMIKEADQALYSAKQNGRNRAECYQKTDKR